MEIEQQPPKQPNFLLIIILFCVSLIVIFVLAYSFISFNGKHLIFGHHAPHPTSQLVLPLHSSPTTLA